MDRHLSIVVCLCATYASVGCSDESVEPSLLAGPRILALRASVGAAAGSGETHVLLDVLGWKLGAPTFDACDTAWLAANPPRCATRTVSLGTGSTVDVITSLNDALNIRVADGVGADTLFAVGSFAAPKNLGVNPTVTALRAADGATLVVAPDGTLIVEVAVAAPHDGMTVTFLTSGGRMRPYRSPIDASTGVARSTLTAPTTPGPLTLYGVVRTGDGGVGWATATVTVKNGGTP